MNYESAKDFITRIELAFLSNTSHQARKEALEAVQRRDREQWARAIATD